jgi:hypothetical protein
MKYEQPYGVADPNAPYVNGNPQIGLQGSIPPAASIEYPQREIVHMIEKSNLVPTDTDLYQLTESVRSQFVNFANDIGTQDQLFVRLDPPLLAYTPGLVLRVRVAVTNSGSSTIDAGVGPVLIKRSTGLPCSQGDLPAGGVVSMVYDGTAFQIINSAGYGGGVSGGPPPVLSAIPYTVDTSAIANIITAPFSPAITALTAGTILLVKVANTVTGSTAINVNALNNIPVKANGHGALLPGDIVAGDVKMFVYDGTNFWITPNYLSAAFGHGRCYLSLAAPNLVLMPVNGNGIVINGALYPVPSGGVTLSPSGGAGVNYIYALVQNNAIVLEASVVAPALNSDGVMVKTGDVTRSLVGKAYVNQYGQWQDQDGFLGVLSWFNRRPKRSLTNTGGAAPMWQGANTTYMEIRPDIRNYFICWSEEMVEAEVRGMLQGINCTTYWAAVAFDGHALPEPDQLQEVCESNYLGGNYAFSAHTPVRKSGLADNLLHYAAGLFCVGAGTLGVGYGGAQGGVSHGAGITVMTRG